MSGSAMTELEKMERVKQLLEELNSLKHFNRIKDYRPYQKQRDFHCLGKTHNQRLLMGGNQLGKTFCGAAELVFHLTGEYPDDWDGFVFPYPIQAIAGSTTFEMTMAGIQRTLLGNPTDRAAQGTGAIPKAKIVEVKMAGTLKDLVATIIVKHASGFGNSTLKLTCYAKGRESWQAAKADLIWFDEEPPIDVYDEGITRLTVGSGPDYGYPDMRGMAYTTFTPLKGPTQVVNGFYPAPRTPNKAFVMLGIYDVDHLTEEQKAKRLEEIEPHLREARGFGIPVLGEGAIFNFDWNQILVDPIHIPPHFHIINGIDFGFDHPSAAVSIAVDRDNDIIYVTNCIKSRQKSSEEFASMIRLWKGEWAWPHDGAQHDKGSGETLANQYRKHGIKMLPERATHDGKSNSLEASISDVQERFLSHRLFIFKTPNNENLMSELRQYHRKEGRPVALNDDAISAMRYSIMMNRFASADKERQTVVDKYRQMNRRRGGDFASGGNSSYMAT